jgi:predicted dienelactone hydrolase
MRPFECVILFLDLFYVLWLTVFVDHVRTVGVGFSIASITAFIVHLLAERYRWHMLPAYFLLVLPVVMVLRNPVMQKNQSAPCKRTRIITGAIGILMFIIAVSLPAYLFPAFKFDKPTGPYAVGTVSRYWIDHSRQGDCTTGSMNPRELMVQIWYPAEPGTGTGIAPYHPNIQYLTDELARVFGLPRLMFSNFHYVRSYSLTRAQISKARQNYPVLLFSHGFNGYRFQNTFQVEELASHGYIVVGIDHTYVSAGTVFPDGRAVPAHRLDHFTEDWLRPFLVEWVADARFVLDQLSRINSSDPEGTFTGRLDLTKVGYFGHSFGGAAAAQTLSVDRRFKAGINMDGFPFGNAHVRGVKQPFMHLQSDRSLADVSEEELASMNMTRQKLQQYSDEWDKRMFKICNHGNILRIRGTKHFDFSDCPLWTPLTSWIGFTGKISTKRIHHIINVYTLAFFDKYLQGKESALPSGPSSKYPEIEFRPSYSRRH